MSDAKPEKRKKPRFTERMKNRGREAKALGTVLTTEPRSFPRELSKLVRRSMRTVWDARGGGLYACGFLLTFVFLEIRMFVVDIYTADSVGDFFTGQASDFLFKYVGQSLQNTISAFIWPVRIIEMNPMWGGIILAAMFVLFPRYLKAPVERWLFDDCAATKPAETP